MRTVRATRRGRRIAAVALAVVALGTSHAGATAAPPVDPAATVPPLDPAASSTVPATTLPPGCDIPDPAVAVFVGEVIATDVRTARFQVGQVRAGSLTGFEVAGLVDVDYEQDVRYLEIGEVYLVGAGANTITGRLHSTVRSPAPLFGGNQVADLDDSEVECPVVEDPVRTLLVDGSSVESGVLTPLLEEPDRLLRALVMPAIWAFLALLALAAVKNLLWMSGREVLRFGRGQPRRPPAGG